MNKKKGLRVYHLFILIIVCHVLFNAVSLYDIKYGTSLNRYIAWTHIPFLILTMVIFVVIVFKKDKGDGEDE